MAGIRWPAEEARAPAAAADLISDDDRSVAADSWSIKSEYGSTLDDDQRHAEASEVLSTGPPASDYSSDKEEPDASEVETSMLGLQSYWDDSYAEDLANFQEHGHAGEVWFGVEVMNAVATWTKNICVKVSQGLSVVENNNYELNSGDAVNALSSWSVLDLGTGNGLLLQELAKQGFSDLTGTDYSEGAITLARNLAVRDGFPNINFLVDDVLETKLDRKFQLVTDKGTLDAIGLHPEGPVRRVMYWDSISNLVGSGGIVVITSCNHTKDELLQEVERFNESKLGSQDLDQDQDGRGRRGAVFQYLDHVRTYPSIMFGGVEGSRVATVAFRRS